MAMHKEVAELGSDNDELIKLTEKLSMFIKLHQMHTTINGT